MAESGSGAGKIQDRPRATYRTRKYGSAPKTLHIIGSRFMHLIIIDSNAFLFMAE